MNRSRKEAKIEKFFAYERHRMVRRQIKARGVRDKALLKAMKDVPREKFVPEALREFAYDDGPLPIGEAQTISQPYIVALMIEAAGLTPYSKVLEIGAGSGYCVAIMSCLAGKVFAIERNAALAGELGPKLQMLGYSNIELRQGDGSLGWPEEAPFDAILVSAGAPHMPEALLDQLAPSGRLVVPVGSGENGQRLLRIVRGEAGAFEENDLGGVSFVPLIGADGFVPAPDRPGLQD